MINRVFGGDEKEYEKHINSLNVFALGSFKEMFKKDSVLGTSLTLGGVLPTVIALETLLFRVIPISTVPNAFPAVNITQAGIFGMTRFRMRFTFWHFPESEDYLKHEKDKLLEATKDICKVESIIYSGFLGRLLGLFMLTPGLWLLLQHPW